VIKTLDMPVYLTSLNSLSDPSLCWISCDLQVDCCCESRREFASCGAYNPEL